MPLAGQADPLAVVDPRRDRHLDRSLLDDSAGTAALGARLLDPPPSSRTRRAGLGADELAEDAPRHLLEASGAVACGARRYLAARLRAVPSAMRAGDCRFEGHLAGHAVRGLDEVDLHRRCEVCAAGASITGAAAEEDVVAEEGREEVGQVAEIDVAGL